MNEPTTDYYIDPATGEMVNTSNELVTTDETVMVRADAAPSLMDPKDLPDFEQMEEGFSLAQQYKRFTTPGQIERGMLLGFNEMKGTDGKIKPIALFQNKQGVWANAGDNLVSQIIHLPKGTPVQVTYKGDVRTKGGFTVKTFEVKLLNPKPIQAAPPPPPEVEVGNLGTGPNIPSKKKQTA